MKPSDFFSRYRRWIGPAVVLISILGLEVFSPLLRDYRFATIILNLLVYLITVYGGNRSGIVAGVLSIIFHWYFLLTPGHPYNEAPHRVVAMAVWALAIPSIIVFLAGYVQRWREAGEQQLETVTRDYYSLLDSASDGILIADEKGALLQVNLRACEMMGCGREELLRMTFTEMIHPDSPEMFMFDELQAGKSILVESLLKRADGSKFPVEISAKMLFDKRFQAIVRDISERKRREEQLYLSEQRFWGLIENSADAVTLVDAEGTILYTSPSTYKLLGYESFEFVGRNMFDFIRNDAARTREIFNNLLSRENESVEYELRMRHKNGTTRWFGLVATNMFGVPYIQAIVANYHDITDRKHSDEKRKALESNLVAILENTQDSLYSVDRELRILVINSAFRKVFHLAYGIDLQSGVKILDNLADETRQEWENYYSRALAGESFIIEKSYVFPNLLIDVEVSFHPISGGEGSITGVSVFSRNVTERKKAQKELLDNQASLRESLSLLAATLESTADGILVVDHKGKILSFNDRFRRLWRIPQDVLSSKDDDAAIKFVLSQLTDPDGFLAKVRELYAHPDESSFDAIEFMDGRIFERYSLPQWVEGKPVGRVWSFRDVTERERSQEALRKSEERYRSIFENISEGIYQATEEGKFITVNPALVRILGYDRIDEVISLNLNRDIFLKDTDRDELNKKTLEHGRGVYSEVFWKKKNGDIIQVRLHDLAVFDQDGRFSYYEVTVEDVSDQKRLEQSLIQAQKLETIGQIAGGVAHDMNNMLAVILPTAELLKNSAGDPKAIKFHSEIIASTALRASDIIKQLLVYARRTTLRITRVGLNELIIETQKMMNHVLDKKITVELQLDPQLPPIDGDATQIQQVLMNLMVNARDAMPDGGRIIIVSRPVSLDRSRTTVLENMEPGEYVECMVRDTGTGIDKPSIAKIFDAFYSTKEIGKGTGLGLAVAKSILQNHRGAIEVESQLRKGTAFRFYLPVVDTIPKQHPAGHAKAPEKGSGRILVVDDERQILDISRRILEPIGYEVSCVASGKEAIESYRKKPSQLVILDIQMPDMDGRETLLELRKINPSLKALFVSGFAGPDLIDTIHSELKVGILSKPFSVDDLRQAVRLAIHSSRS